MRDVNLIDRIYNWVGAMFVLLVIPVNACYWVGISPVWGLLAPFVLGLVPWLHPYWFGPYGYGPGQRKRYSKAEEKEPVQQ
jgi:hypothetical protein